jgi:hypothetical protein
VAIVSDRLLEQLQEVGPKNQQRAEKPNENFLKRFKYLTQFNKSSEVPLLVHIHGVYLVILFW